MASIGTASKANNATNPPEDMNFYLIMSELKIPFYTAFFTYPLITFGLLAIT